MALVERRLLIEDGSLLDVRGELPLVRGVCLGDVDEREVRPVAEALEEALDVTRPATKRRSGVAPEDEQERPVTDESCEVDRLEIIGPMNRGAGEGISDLERLGVAVAHEARDHGVAFRAGGEARDVGAVFRIDDGRERAVLGSPGHVPSIRRLAGVALRREGTTDRVETRPAGRWRYGVAKWGKVV
jgi:hypothetical protein